MLQHRLIVLDHVGVGEHWADAVHPDASLFPDHVWVAQVLGEGDNGLLGHEVGVVGVAGSLA